MRLSSVTHKFFSKYLPHIKAVSPRTIKAYRNTFKLFIPFAANYDGIKISSLQIAHLSVEVVLEFLDSLEKKRQNSAKTRNSRLAAIKSLAKMIRFMYPDQRKLADRILSIPQKRCQRQLIGFLYPYENEFDLQSIRSYRRWILKKNWACVTTVFYSCFMTPAPGHLKSQR